MPTPSPSAHPMADSTRLSVSSWRMTRRRPAPSAARMASSRVRTVARASSRLATLAQQMRSTKPTTARKSIDVSRSSRPTSASCSGSSATPRPVLVSGNSRASPPATAAKSARAASSVTPGFIRPMTLNTCARRSPGCWPLIDLIAQMLLRPTNCASAGTTPTTVKGSPSSRSTRPTTDGSAWNRVCQNASLSTTTFRRSRSSEGRNVRPATGLMPSTSKTPEVTHWRSTVSAVAVCARHHHAADAGDITRQHLEGVAALVPVAQVGGRDPVPGRASDCAPTP